MINGDIEQFLDTGWYCEAELYYQGHVYWCEGEYLTPTDTHFWVYRWKAVCDDNKYYHTVLGKDGEPEEWSVAYDIHAGNLDEVRRRFLQAPLFDGRTFWQAEHDIAWVDDSNIPVRQ